MGGLGQMKETNEIWLARRESGRLVRSMIGLSLVAISCMGTLTASASARWGKEHCSEVTHCYGLAGRNIEAYGGVLASIDFVDNPSGSFEGHTVPGATGGFVDGEEWISWPKKPEEWIETGQANGFPYSCCVEHPFYAEQLKGVYKEYLSPGTVALNTYNHYVLFDSEINGRWHIYWGCCEVGYYGGGWPAYLMNQEAGIEAATAEQPYVWGSDEVAASNGGEWTPWSPGLWTLHDPGICVITNPESPSAGNISWSTQPGC
jgi:hypothetical protein